MMSDVLFLSKQKVAMNKTFLFFMYFFACTNLYCMKRSFHWELGDESCDGPVKKRIAQHTIEKKSVLEGARRYYKGNFDVDYPLHVAIDAGNIEKIKLLAFDKAHIDRVAGNMPFEITPLIVAVKKCDVEVVQLLIDCEADVNKKAGLDTPLICAVYQDAVEIVKLLLDAKADPNVKFALYKAVKNINEQIVRLLLAAGADPNVTNCFGCSPLHKAVLSSRRNPGVYVIAQLLIAYGANPNAEDWLDVTPLQIAIRRNYDGLAELLVQGPDFIKGLRLALNAFAMVMHGRCGKGSLAQRLCPPHIIHNILSRLKSGTSYVYDPSEVALYANMYRQ